MARAIKTYQDFWPLYLKAHSKPVTRALHYAGTTGFLAVGVYAVWSGNLWMLVFTLLLPYAFAWLSHFLIEYNEPLTFTYPLWSLISDFRMFALGVTGRIGPELKKYRIGPPP